MELGFIHTTIKIANEIEEAEWQSVAAYGLLENVVYPTFEGYSCEGAMDEYSKQTGGDKDKAARLWMEEHYDALCAACLAANVLVRGVSDILQTLPRAEVMQHG